MTSSLLVWHLRGRKSPLLRQVVQKEEPQGQGGHERASMSLGWGKAKTLGKNVKNAVGNIGLLTVIWLTNFREYAEERCQKWNPRKHQHFRNGQGEEKPTKLGEKAGGVLERKTWVTVSNATDRLRIKPTKKTPMGFMDSATGCHSCSRSLCSLLVNLHCLCKGNPSQFTGLQLRHTGQHSTWHKAGTQ